MLLHTNTKLSTAPRTTNQTLHVVAVVSNPVGYGSRYRLAEQFYQHMKGFNVHLTTVELAFGQREFVVTPGQHAVQYRTNSELWHKENMVNLGIQHLPSDWQYVAWLDADIGFTNPHWVNQTINALQHYQVVQVFQDVVDLGPNGEHLQTYRSLGGLKAAGAVIKPTWKTGPQYYGTYGHPGFAWAARREAIDNLGGLMDFSLAGSADHHMALAFLGMAKDSLPGNVTRGYAAKVMAFQDRAERYIRRNIGGVPGTIVHYWHGKKADRGYERRWGIILDNKYDPDTDIKRDSQGVLALHDHGDARSIKLRDDLRNYFRSRNEDSIDT